MRTHVTFDYKPKHLKFGIDWRKTI